MQMEMALEKLLDSKRILGLRSFENTIFETDPTDNAHSQKFYHVWGLQSTGQGDEKKHEGIGI